MNTLRIYGVNYAASLEFSWTNMLAAKLDMKLDNKALDGSSTEYAIKQLLSDVRSDKIMPGDVIVYVPMHMGRLHFTHQNSVAPKTAALYIHNSRNIDKSHTWYWDNQHHIEWWMNNVDRELLDINFESYIQLVRTLAQGMPNNTFIVLPAYKSTINIPKYTSSSNFLMPDIELFKVSEAELIDQLFDVTLMEFVRYDARTNHLTLPNQIILSDLLYESIVNLDVSNISYDCFQQQIMEKITNKRQYLDYVSRGYIHKRPWQLEWLPD
jgi:hypothetical protein